MSPVISSLWRVVDVLFAPRRTGYVDPVFGWVSFSPPKLRIPLERGK